jgi:hypothetical protein
MNKGSLRGIIVREYGIEELSHFSHEWAVLGIPVKTDMRYILCISACDVHANGKLGLMIRKEQHE